MPMWDSSQSTLFPFQIRIQQIDKYDHQWDQCCEDGFSQKEITKYRGEYAAHHKYQQHAQMLCHTGKISGIPVTDGLCHGNGHLTPVIGTEGRCHRDTSCLTEGVILPGRSGPVHSPAAVPGTPRRSFRSG